jgi:phage shock protein PspC (stress-responsive transcriptional regulator)
MHKVIVINLNGNAYQVDEVGYDTLRGYLDGAERQLNANPDLAEIMADLEQAIGEKCQRFLGPHKTVVSAAEVEQILAEMGPVDAASGEGAGHASGGDTGTAQEQAGSQKTRADAGPAKRLYQIRDGAMISGVCNGLAAYFNIDVTIIRIVFVILAVITKGVWVAVYFVMMFVVPHATTSEEHAEAQGLPFNARELIDQAKQNFSDLKNNKEQWKRQWKGQHRRWRRQFVQQQRAWRRTVPEMFWSHERARNLPYAARVLAGATLPIFGLISAAMFMLFVYALISLSTQGMIFGWALPSNVPLWAGLLGLFVVYQVMTAPLKVGRYAAYQAAPGWYSPWAGVVEAAFSVLFVGLVYAYVPEFRVFINAIGTVIRDLLRSGATLGR